MAKSRPKEQKELSVPQGKVFAKRLVCERVDEHTGTRSTSNRKNTTSDSRRESWLIAGVIALHGGHHTAVNCTTASFPAAWTQPRRNTSAQDEVSSYSTSLGGGTAPDLEYRQQTLTVLQCVVESFTHLSFAYLRVPVFERLH